jgi:hypothetical protein
MQKFNYKVSIEAPSREIADMLMDFICKDNFEILQMMKQAEEKKETKINEPETTKQPEKEKFLKGIRQFETVIQIIERCVMDDSALDKIAKMFGIDVKPETAKQ